MRDSFSADLLAWYDREARVLPWRVAPDDLAHGLRPDPYRVWLSEVMLQQTTVAAVRAYFTRFTTRWPDVMALAAAHDAEVMAEWAGLGYYARARNLLACARAVTVRGGFPDRLQDLVTLPGIGPYTAAAVAAIAFDRPAVVVDGNVERVIARLHRVETPLPAAKRELTALTARLTPDTRPGDFAQAMMDLGATICTPRRPDCALCPWAPDCAGRQAGDAETFPRKAPKAARPRRDGLIWVARRDDGAVLLERRPPRGLLGGMLGFPGSPWEQRGGGSAAPPLAAEWRPAPVQVRHTFTHFDLYVDVQVADVTSAAIPLRGSFVPPADAGPGDLPSLMRKVWDVAQAALQQGD